MTTTRLRRPTRGESNDDEQLLRRRLPSGVVPVGSSRAALAGGAKGGVGREVSICGRFIILSAPAVCHSCQKFLNKGRGAFWSGGIVRCVKCQRERHGDAPMDPEEQQLIDEEADE